MDINISFGNFITIFVIIVSAVIFIMRLEGKIRLLQKETEGQRDHFRKIVENALLPICRRQKYFNQRLRAIEEEIGNPVPPFDGDIFGENG